MQTSDVLNRAADLIEERGWSSGSGWDHEHSNGLCIEGGMLAALGLRFPQAIFGDFWGCPAYRAVQSYLGRSLEVTTRLGPRGPVEPLWMWNDGQRNAVRVIEALRACAVIEASRERQPVPA